MQLFRSAGTLARQTGQVVPSLPIRFLLRWLVYAILLAAMAGCRDNATPVAVPPLTEAAPPTVLPAIPTPTATIAPPAQTPEVAAAATATASPTATTAPPEATETVSSTGVERLLDGAWSEGAPMPTARSEMPAALLDGLIYVPGGFGGEQALEAYDPAADRWHILAPCPKGATT
jgi:hypothetical protein